MQLELDLYPVRLTDRNGTEIFPGARGVSVHWGTEYPILVQDIHHEPSGISYCYVTQYVDGVAYPDLYRYPESIEIREDM